MSDLENRLLEFWKADAKVYRKLTLTMYGREEDEDTSLSLAQISAVTPKKHAPILKICKWCQQEFLTPRADRKYCSRRCQKKANNKGTVEYQRRKRIAKGLPVRRRRVTGTMRIVEKNDRLSLGPLAHCAHCGDLFAPSSLPALASRTFYCSETCRERARNDRRNNQRRDVRHAAGARHG
jgi:hypothetical protein